MDAAGQNGHVTVRRRGRPSRPRLRRRGRSSRLGMVLCAIGLAPWIGLPAAHAAEPLGSRGPTCTITVRDTLLSADIERAGLGTVLREVERVTGVRTRWLGPESDQQVSVRFVDLPFRDTIERILGTRSFVVGFSAAGDPARLSVLSTRGEPSDLDAGSVRPVQATSVTRHPDPDRADPPRDPERALRLQIASGDPDVSLSAIDRLVAEGGGSQAADALEYLVEDGTDPALRMAALSGLQAVGADDPQLLFQTAVTDPDGSVREQATALLLGRVGRDAEAHTILRHLARHHADERVRRTARRVLAHAQAP